MYETFNTQLCRQYAADRRATLERQAYVARVARQARLTRRERHRKHR